MAQEYDGLVFSADMNTNIDRWSAVRPGHFIEHRLLLAVEIGQLLVLAIFCPPDMAIIDELDGGDKSMFGRTWMEFCNFLLEIRSATCIDLSFQLPINWYFFEAAAARRTINNQIPKRSINWLHPTRNINNNNSTDPQPIRRTLFVDLRGCLIPASSCILPAAAAEGLWWWIEDGPS